MIVISGLIITKSSQELGTRTTLVRLSRFLSSPAEATWFDPRFKIIKKAGGIFVFQAEDKERCCSRLLNSWAAFQGVCISGREPSIALVDLFSSVHAQRQSHDPTM